MNKIHVLLFLSSICLLFFSRCDAAEKTAEYSSHLAKSFFSEDNPEEEDQQQRPSSSNLEEKQRQRRTRAIGSEVVTLHNRIEETLAIRDLFDAKNGDRIEVILDNVDVVVGAVKLRLSKHKEISIPQKAKNQQYVEINKSYEKNQKFSINSKDTFKRTVSSVIYRGFRSKKSDIQAKLKATPNSRTNKVQVKYNIDSRAPYAQQVDVTLPVKFEDINVPPRTKVEVAGYFNVIENTAPYTSRLTLNADGKINIHIYRKVKGTERKTTVTMSLREAISPQRGNTKDNNINGFEFGKTDNQVLFTVKGRLYWTTTEKVILYIRRYSLDDSSGTANVPYRITTMESPVTI